MLIGIIIGIFIGLILGLIITTSYTPLVMIQRWKWKIAVKGSNKPKDRLQLGYWYADNNQYDKAITEYKRALKLDPNFADAHYELGHVYKHLGDRKTSTFHFEEFIRLKGID